MYDKNVLDGMVQHACNNLDIDLDYLNKLIPSVDIPPNSAGNVEISKKYIEPSHIYNMRLFFQGRIPIPYGNYTMLYIDDEVMMSDTPSEKYDHLDFVENAKGNVLIAGLGLGVVLNAVAIKDDVEKITIVESSQHVIDLVASTYIEKFKSKVDIVHKSIFDYKPHRKYDSVWFDIWQDISYDNLKDMNILEKRYRTKDNWINSWSKDYLISKDQSVQNIFSM